MHTPIRIRFVVAPRKACAVILLGVVTMAASIVAPVRDVAMGQSGTGSQAPSYTAIDLNPNGFIQSFANGIAGGRVVGNGIGSGTSFTFPGHALMWRGTAASVVDLHQFLPQDFATSLALGIDATGDVVGSATRASDMFLGRSHAIWWHRTGTGFVGTDLHPPSGFLQSAALGISGGKQVGSGTPPGGSALPHALSWSGSPGSVVDLQPPGFISSEASSIAGGQIVGDGGLPGIPCGPGCVVEPGHALSWGSAGSAVDIHPAGFSNSSALGISGAQIVGSGCPGAARSFCAGPNHALLWGSGGSVVDLHPSRFDVSQALGTNGRQQVGTGVTGGHEHALVWSGSASTVVDLHRFLPSNFTDSRATAIDSSGKIVGWASDGRNPHAFMWTPSAVAVIILPGVPSSWTPDAKRIIEGSFVGQVFSVNTLINELKKMIANHLPTTALQPLKQYDTLISTLKAQGIPTFPMPYDWANGGVQAAAQDLDGFIQSVRNQGFDQVDIIAHSTGGLVAQQYIQNSLNASANPHVRNLLMLGTPNQGAVKAHCFIFPSALCVGRTVSLWDLADISIVLLAQLARISPATIESLGQLMPTFPYVVDIATTPRQFIPNPRPTPTCGNGCLFDNAYTSRLVAATRGRLNNGTFGGINVYAEQGTGSLTAVTVAVRPRQNPTTVLDASFGSGDKTVLQQSALFLARGVTNISVPGALHGSTVIDCGTSLYLSIVRGATTACTTAVPPPLPGFPLVIVTHSPVKPLLTDPLGRTTGFDFTTGTNVANIPTSTLLDGDSPAIFLSAAIRGQYRLELLGVSPGGAFGLDIIYPNAFPNGFDNTVEEISGTIRPRQRLRFAFDVLAFQDVTKLFAAFQTRLEINAASRSFEMNGTFTLGAGGTISPETQPVTIQVGMGFLITIPPGSFRRDGEKSVFEGTVNGVALEASLRRTGGQTYAFKIEAARARNLPDFNPVEVRLGIGNNGGSVSVKAELD